MGKESIRKEMIKKRESMSAEEVDSLSNAICSKLASIPAVRDANSVGIYLSFRNEVCVESLFENFSDEGKRIFAPIVEGDSIRFARLPSLNDVDVGFRGVKEPRSKNYTGENSIDVFLVPGVAFDKDGFRLGWGRGYYDSFLSNKKEVAKIGIAYDFQIVENCEAEMHDVRMDFVVTERRLLSF